MTEAALFWLFALALTVHNLEEGLFLPAFTEQMPRLAAHVTPFSFRFALVVFTAGTYVVVGLAVAGGALAGALLAGLALVMAVNAVAPHLTLTMACRRYAPGTGTGLFIMLPVSVILVARSLSAGHLTGGALVLSAVTVAVAMIVLLPALFLAGRRIERRLPQHPGTPA